MSSSLLENPVILKLKYFGIQGLSLLFHAANIQLELLCLGSVAFQAVYANGVRDSDTPKLFHMERHAWCRVELGALRQGPMVTGPLKATVKS